MISFRGNINFACTPHGLGYEASSINDEETAARILSFLHLATFLRSFILVAVFVSYVAISLYFYQNHRNIINQRFCN